MATRSDAPPPGRQQTSTPGGDRAPEWSRSAPFASSLRTRFTERWRCTGRDGTHEFDVRTRIGKPLDVTKFRSVSLEQDAEYVSELEATTARLYGDPAALRGLARCPACGADAGRASRAAEFYGIGYVCCGDCEHWFVARQPDPAHLNAYFEDSDEVSSVYTDDASNEIRMEQVIAPKVGWVQETCSEALGAAPRSVLDVGAGAGHFVAGCRRAGLRADGFELNRAAVRFAERAFDVGLRQGDFLGTQPGPEERYDVVTLWGVLEYTPDPAAFLEAARRWLAPERGMLVVEVPRADAISTVSQAAWTRAPVRHAVPSSHVNLFSDASLATLLFRCGFQPAAAWYFGMDAFEMLSRQAVRLGSTELVDRLADAIPTLQAAFDRGRVCDDVIVAAVPRP